MSMNSMEHYYQNKGGKKESSNSPEKKPDSTPLSSKVKTLLLRAFIGAGTIGIAAIGISELLDNGAQRAAAAAGLSPEMANDPEVLDYALDHTTEEIRVFADNLARNKALMINNTANNMEEMTIDLETLMDATQTDEAEAPLERFPLEQVSEGVYSFKAGQNIDVTSQNFIKQLRESLGQAGQVFFAVPDDNYGTTRVFTDSTINGYRDNYGNFYAYVGDLVYVATDGQALNNTLDAQGINHETFGLP